ncbi:MAG: EAL domain-containing protein [Bacillota bacterium]|nr:EAL domain-containing protein [Bacillota bacterium]
MRTRRPNVAWQPVVDIAAGVVVGHEALARFAGGQDPAAAFAIAERRGVALQLDALCRAQALRDPPRSGLVFVNLAPATVAAMEDGLVRLHAGSAGPGRIVWELPERAGWPRDERAAAAVRAALPPGSRLALDDFGAGSADLEKLVAVRPDVIKLARALTSGVSRSPARAALVEAVLRWARRFGATVVAEGVELREDAEALRRLGVPWGQGFLWGAPAIRHDVLGGGDAREGQETEAVGARRPR